MADSAGKHHTTVNRVLSLNPKEQTKLTSDWVRIFAAALDIAVEDLIGPDSAGQIRTITVKGDVEAGAWAESWEWPEDDWFQVGIADDPSLRSFSLYGARTRGASMNRRYPEGTVLIFNSIEETQEALEPGRRYIVERQRPDGRREMTVKTLWRDPESNEFLLIPESNDPRHQEPIRVTGDEEDVVQIVGRVVGSYQQE